MHPEVLRPEQSTLLPLLKHFRKRFYLAGGTAMALHLGHRFSLDFDLFSFDGFQTSSLKNTLKLKGYSIDQLLYEDKTQMSCLVSDVKLTFLQFPYQINTDCDFQGLIKLPDLLTLAAMKAFALGGRGKWKDYVDLYHIFKDHYQFSEVAAQARSIFGEVFNEKLFRQQLAYYDDVSFAEEVEYLSHPLPQDDIKSFLTDISLCSI